jgi:hypothetical protein
MIRGLDSTALRSAVTGTSKTATSGLEDGSFVTGCRCSDGGFEEVDLEPKVQQCQ